MSQKEDDDVEIKKISEAYDKVGTEEQLMFRTVMSLLLIFENPKVDRAIKIDATKRALALMQSDMLLYFCQWSI